MTIEIQNKKLLQRIADFLQIGGGGQRMGAQLANTMVQPVVNILGATDNQAVYNHDDTGVILGDGINSEIDVAVGFSRGIIDKLLLPSDMKTTRRVICIEVDVFFDVAPAAGVLYDLIIRIGKQSEPTDSSQGIPWVQSVPFIKGNGTDKFYSFSSAYNNGDNNGFQMDLHQVNMWRGLLLPDMWMRIELSSRTDTAFAVADNIRARVATFDVPFGFVPPM